MKYINNIIVLIAAVLMLSSCGDEYLTISPSTSIGSDVVIESVDDIKNALNGAYDILSDDNYYQSDMIMIADMMGDDFMNPTWSSNWLNGYYSYAWTKISSSFNSQYSLIFYGINHVNEILAKAENIEATGEYDNYIAQLRAIRAIMYFDIIRLYGPLYSNLGKGAISADALGVPLLTEPIDDVFAPFYREKTSVIYNFIYDELKAVVGNVQVEKNNGYLNQAGVQAELARVCLYMEKNDEALSYAEALIGNSDYSLIEKAEYVASWRTEFNSESIFEMSVSEEDNASWNNIGYIVNDMGYKEAVATDDFLALMLIDPDDVRFELLSYDEGVDAYYASLKYPGRGDNVKINNPKVLRLSEMYLIAAEAAFKAGNTTKAGKYLSDLREKRTETEARKYETSVSLDDVLYERRLELFCEGHRAWDLWRNQRSVVRYTSGAEKLEKGHSDDAAGSDGVIEFDYYKTIAPIVEQELDLLPAEDRDGQQNPGY